MFLNVIKEEIKLPPMERMEAIAEEIEKLDKHWAVFPGKYERTTPMRRNNDRLPSEIISVTTKSNSINIILNNNVEISINTTQDNENPNDITLFISASHIVSPIRPTIGRNNIRVDLTAEG